MLNGPEKATPRRILKLMNIEGLTIYHIKSHLQKYRLTKRGPESRSTGEPSRSTGGAESDVVPGAEAITMSGDQAPESGSRKRKESDDADDNPSSMVDSASTMFSEKRRKSLEEALLLQMKVQKQLHEQLASQRQLQLSLEAHARYISSLAKEEGLYDKYPHLKDWSNISAKITESTLTQLPAGSSSAPPMELNRLPCSAAPSASGGLNNLDGVEAPLVVGGEEAEYSGLKSIEALLEEQELEMKASTDIENLVSHALKQEPDKR